MTADSKWLPVNQLMPTVGRWDVTETRYLGPDTPESRHQLGLCLSGISMNEGEISVSVRLSVDAAGQMGEAAGRSSSATDQPVSDDFA